MRRRYNTEKQKIHRRFPAAILAVFICAAFFALPVRAAEDAPLPSWRERIETGDFSLLKEETQETIGLLTATHESLHPYSRYVLQDVNHDGLEELLWLYEGRGEEPVYLLAVFVNGYDAVRMVLHAPADEDLGEIRPEPEDEECYIVNGERILYLSHNTWTVGEVHCTEVLFDRNFDTFAGEGLTMYLVADEEAYMTEVDAALRRRLSFVDGRGVWYFRVPTGSETDEGIRIGADAFMSSFRELSGRTFAQTVPFYETMRTGIERGVSRQQFLYRPGPSDPDVACAVAWPQIEEGASSFAPAINTILKQEAFMMSDAFSYATEETRAEPEAYLQTYLTQNGGTGEEIQYRILHDDDTMISVLFRARRDAEEDADAMKLLTVSKLNGRQIQIGDLTTTGRLEEAIRGGTAEVFALDEDLRRMRNNDTGKEEITKAFGETIASSEAWKSIGLDEQYLYLVLQREARSAFLLRIPRWDAGVDSPGHMHLLTMHRAYPYLKDVLDDAECLTVRRRAGGYDITYRTMDGGSVSARLGASEEKERDFASPEEARDYYMSQYADVTGFAVGTFVRQDPAAPARQDTRENRGRFYATETAFGEGGRALLVAGERIFELTQRCRATRGGFLLKGDAGWSDAEGMLRMEIDGNGVWTNDPDEMQTVIRRMTAEHGWRFLLYRTEDAGTVFEMRREGAGQPEIRVEAETTEQPLLVFEDYNEDGTTDVACRFSDERYLYFYDAEGDRFTEAPEMLRTAEDFRYDAGTGFLIVTERETEQIKEEVLYLPEQPQEAVRRLESSVTADGRHLRIRDLETEEERVLLDMTVTDAAEGVDDTALQAEALFRTRILWQDLFDAPGVLQEAVTEGSAAKRRVIAGQFFRQDLFTPYYENRLYVLEDGGKLLYTYDVPVQTRMSAVTRGYEGGEESLFLQFEDGEQLVLPVSGLYESITPDETPGSAG